MKLLKIKKQIKSPIKDYFNKEISDLNITYNYNSVFKSKRSLKDILPILNITMKKDFSNNTKSPNVLFKKKIKLKKTLINHNNFTYNNYSKENNITKSREYLNDNDKDNNNNNNNYQTVLTDYHKMNYTYYFNANKRITDRHYNKGKTVNLRKNYSEANCKLKSIKINHNQITKNALKDNNTSIHRHTYSHSQNYDSNQNRSRNKTTMNVTASTKEIISNKHLTHKNIILGFKDGNEQQNTPLNKYRVLIKRNDLITSKLFLQWNTKIIQSHDYSKHISNTLLKKAIQNNKSNVNKKH